MRSLVLLFFAVASLFLGIVALSASPIALSVMSERLGVDFAKGVAAVLQVLTFAAPVFFAFASVGILAPSDHSPTTAPEPAARSPEETGEWPAAPTDSSVCRACRSNLRPDAHYCSNCGTPVDETPSE